MPGLTAIPSDPEARRTYARLVGAKVSVQMTRTRGPNRLRKEMLITEFPCGTRYEEPYDQRLLQDWQVQAINYHKRHNMDASISFTAEL